MQFLAIEKELAPTSAVEHSAVLTQEAARVWELKKAGVVREIWFDSQRCAVVLLECASEQVARTYLHSLPLVRAGLIDFEVRALRPYDGFDRLIGRTDEKPIQSTEPVSPPRRDSSLTRQNHVTC